MQAYHRDVLEHMSPTAAAIHPPPPPPLTNQPSAKASPEVVPDRDRVARSPPRRVPVKRGKEKRSGSRRHRSRTVIGRDANLF